MLFSIDCKNALSKTIKHTAMKLKIFYWVFLLCSVSMFAQISKENKNGEDEITSSNANNIIKTNLTAYAFRNINLAYERILNKHSSAIVSFSFVPEGKIPYINTFAVAVKSLNFDNASISHNAFSVEYRLYLNKKGFGRGVYVSPYYRYSKVNLSNVNFNYVSQGFEIPINLSGDLNAHSLGVKTGYQWLIGEKDNWVVDFTVIGGHYGFSDGSLVGVSPFTLDAQQQSDLQNELNDLDLPLIKIDATTTANGATGKVSGPWAGLQFGLSFGYRF